MHIGQEMRVTILLLFQMMVLPTTSPYQSMAPSPHDSAEIPVMWKLVPSLRRDQCSLILFSGGGSSANTITKGTAHLQSSQGVSVFDTEGRSRNRNVSETRLISLIQEAQKVQRLSECVTVLVRSDEEGFLATFARFALEGLLMLGSTRFIILTRVTPQKLQPLSNALAVTDSTLLVVNEKAAKLRVHIYVQLPRSLSTSFIKIADWSVEKGMTYRSQLTTFPEKFKRFRDGDEVTVVAEEYQPHTTLTHPSGSGHAITFTGPMVSLLNILAHGLNFTYSFVRPPDGSWGTRRPDGSWSGMVGVVMRGKADLGLGPFAMSASRAQVIDYLRPILVDYIKILGGRGRLIVDPWGFLLPLASSVWIVLLVSLSVAAYSLSILPCLSLSRISNTSAPNNLFKLIQVLLQQSMLDGAARWWWEQLVLGVWLLMTFVLSRSYAGNLMSLLAVRHIPQPYQNLRDVLDDRAATMIWEINTAYIQYINSVGMGVFEEVAKAGKSGRIKYKKGFEFPEVVDTVVREGDHVLMIEDLTARVLMAQLFSVTGQCDFYTSKDAYLPYIFAMITKKNSRWTLYLNERIRAVTEGGLYERWVADAIPNSTTCLAAPSTITVTSALTLNNLWGLFVLLCGGFLLAALTLGCEITTHASGFGHRGQASTS